MSSSPFLYPSVTSLPGTGGVGAGQGQAGGEKPIKGEFDQSLNGALERASLKGALPGADRLGEARAPVKFSAHATQRMQDRKIGFDAALMAKLSEAVDKADAKGLEDALILSGDAAWIVNVPNRTVVTAMDKEGMKGNVFTQIDGAVWM